MIGRQEDIPGTLSKTVLQAQTQILHTVASMKSGVYLVGGTALAIRYNHRYSEDLDFFTPQWTRALHRKLARRVKAVTDFPFTLVDEQRKANLARMAIYEFQISQAVVLKVDVVEDFDELLHPVGLDGIASLDDSYLRKIRAVIGWTGRRGLTGQALPGGREEAKDLFDLWYLSERYVPLHEWFPRHFGRNDYARLTRWFQAMTRQTTTTALLEISPGCDTKRIRQHLESQIYDQLNRKYVTS